MKKLHQLIVYFSILPFVFGCASSDDKKTYTLDIKNKLGAFDQTRVHLIDYDASRNVFLFRGNLPTSNSKEFVYDQLVQIFQQRAKEAGLNFPAKFFLIDYSLLNVTEEKDLKVEKDFFTKNPTLGQLKNWPLYITSSEEIDSKLATLHQNINDPNVKNTIWYVHCEAGCDRTGIVSAGYRMRFMSKSYGDAQALNLKECGREQNKSSTFLTEQYCGYLKKKGLIADCN